MRRWWWLGLAPFLALSAPAVLGTPAPSCAEAPCRICFVVAEVVDRAGGEPISYAA
ncbi:MAG TPA: hypothetical protein VGL92_06880 [Acidimicrobiia bacterium]